MSFTAIKLLSLLLLPTAFLVTMAAAGVILSQWRFGRALLVLGVAGLVACWFLPMEVWVARPLEDQFPAVTEMPEHLDGIIVLGGAVDELVSQDRGTPALNGAANRLTTMAILARRYPQARMIFTGGSGHIEQGIGNEAKFVRILLDQLGVDTKRIVFEDHSRTTYENAILSLDLMHPQQGELWALVTSAIHMPRSVGVFRKVGWAVLPWPVGYRTREQGGVIAPSLGDKLALLDAAAHEWEGLAGYWVSGETSALLPGP